MGFIIRSAFWLSLVLLLIPIGVDGGNGEPAVSPVQALFAAREAVGDIATMCERKPEVCETGRSALHTIGVRARESAKIAYRMIENENGVAPAGDDPIATGSIPATN